MLVRQAVAIFATQKGADEETRPQRNREDPQRHVRWRQRNRVVAHRACRYAAQALLTATARPRSPPRLRGEGMDGGEQAHRAAPGTQQYSVSSRQHSREEAKSVKKSSRPNDRCSALMPHAQRLAFTRRQARNAPRTAGKGREGASHGRWGSRGNYVPPVCSDTPARRGQEKVVEAVA